MGFFKKLKKIVKKTSPTYHITKKSAEFTKRVYEDKTGQTAMREQIAAQEKLAREQQEAHERALAKAREDARLARQQATAASTFDTSQRDAGVGQVALGTGDVEADLDEQLNRLRKGS